MSQQVLLNVDGARINAQTTSLPPTPTAGEANRRLQANASGGSFWSARGKYPDITGIAQIGDSLYEDQKLNVIVNGASDPLNYDNYIKCLGSATLSRVEQFYSLNGVIKNGVGYGNGLISDVYTMGLLAAEDLVGFDGSDKNYTSVKITNQTFQAIGQVGDGSTVSEKVQMDLTAGVFTVKGLDGQVGQIRLGGAVTDKVGFFGKTPVVQQAAATAAVGTPTTAVIGGTFVMGAGTSTNAWAWSTENEYKGAVRWMANAEVRLAYLETVLAAYGLIA